MSWRAPALTTLHSSLTESLPRDFKDFFYNSQEFIAKLMFNWFSLHYVECSDVRLFWFPLCFDYIYKYFAQLLNFILEISAALM